MTEAQQPLSQINNQYPPFMKGILCPLHDEVEGNKAPRLKVPKEYTPLAVEGMREDTKYRYTHFQNATTILVSCLLTEGRLP